MQPNIYKFYLNGVEITPHYNTLSKKYNKESNQVFFRETIEGELKLYGADYFMVQNSSIYTEHTIVIKKNNGEGYEDYFTGTFNKTDCEIDTDKRACKLKINQNDMYTDIMNNYDNEYNLNDLAPALTGVTVSKKPVLQVYVLEDNVVNNFLPNGVTWETEVDPGISLTELYDDCHFELESRHIEVRINTGGLYDGIYAGKGWQGSILHSANSNYVIIGSVVLISGGYDYTFSIFESNNLSIPLYTAMEFSNSRFATATFLGASSSTAGKSFTAEISMETILGRVLSGFSITNNGYITLGKINEGSFGYLEGYEYTFSTIQEDYGYSFVSTLVPAESETPTTYGKADSGYYFVPPYSDGKPYKPFARSTWVYSSRWIMLTELFTKVYGNYGSIYNDIKDCIHISDVIKVLLNNISPGISHEPTAEYSQFLYGESNPIYGEHYDLFITQKTHIKKFIYDSPATKVPITFEKVMNMLAKCFHCYWYIEDGKFKIEHSYYFEHGKSYEPSSQSIGIDATTTYDNRNGKPISLGQNSIKYDKNLLPSRYEFGYMDESSIEFEGAAVKLTGAYLQKDKTESVTPEDFSADLDMIISNTISISDDGFALIAAKLYEDSDGYKYYSTFDYDMELISESGNTYTVTMQNGVLSWLYLFNYYCTNLSSTIAEYDGYPKKTINVRGVAKCKTQTLKIPLESNPDLYKLVKTDIGEGIIKSVSIDMNTNQATIELLHEID